MIFKVVPTKLVDKWAPRPWYKFLAKDKMLIVQRADRFFIHPDNLLKVLKELRDRGLTVRVETLEAPLPDNVITFDKKPKK